MYIDDQCPDRGSTRAQLAAAQAGTTLPTIKTRLYRPALDLLRDRTDPRG